MELPAILGGTPVREDKIFYGRQWVNEDDVKAVAETLVSDYITCGPKVDELERRLEEYTGAKKVLTAAALTYVAALAVTLMQLLRFLIILNDRRR